MANREDVINVLASITDDLYYIEVIMNIIDQYVEDELESQSFLLGGEGI